MAQENEKVNNANSGAASKQSTSKTKTPKSLKPESKITKKSPSQNKATAKGSKSNQEKPEASNIDRKKGKDVANKNKNKETPLEDQKDESSKEKIGGMIFMCNANTKQDCFRYMVMGLPSNRKDIVATIKPGLKLFLYDFDAKLLYGIYEATSAGGMKLEPAAFGGSYPAQVRFKVHVDCLPLSEGKFKKAIMGDSGGDKLKFDTELTKQQANILTKLFQPSTQLKSHTIIHSSQPVPIPLVPLMPMIPGMEPLHFAHPEALAGGQYSQSLSEKKTPVKSDIVPRDVLSLSEKEYRTYGLRRQPQIPAPIPVPSAAYLSEVVGHTDLHQRRTDECEYRLRPTAGQLATQPASYHGYSSGASNWSEIEYRARLAEANRLHSTHAANVLSDYNKSYRQPGGTGDSANLSVSSRYSFAGPSFAYQ
ncbi:uncharacterized protein M6B38_350435 [Iris pallida]|uniref:DCD domain-containing protein n=1 Tax=Iris pallida TaxID=29817 RepID=A0AAX6GS26_IRIPA|nr:uncharacterized protein M6B38_350435 [Iris pallida]